LERINRDEIFDLIAQRKYFVLHAPRQTGKTTYLLALAEELNRVGQYRALYANLEVAQAAREDVGAAMSALLNQIALQAQLQLQDDYPDQPAG
jgi:predicted AAA+ superfamily ATPase